MAATSKTKDLLYEIGRLKKEIAELKTSKPYGLVWEDKPEQFDKDTENSYPVLRAKGGKFKDVEFDASTDHNVLIEGDNYHALSILSYTHKGKVDVIYIDPPYNTGNASWKYNNKIVDAEDAFRHSKFISFLEKRLVLSRSLLSDKGMIVVTIDDYEIHNVRLLMDQIFGEKNHLGTVVIKNNPSGRSTVKGFSIAHEYALFYTTSEEVGIGRLERTKEQIDQYDESDEEGKFQWRNFMRSGGLNDTRNARPRLYYPLFIANKKVRVPKMQWDQRSNSWTLLEKPDKGEVIIYPVSKAIDYTWRLGVETLIERFSDLRVKTTRDGRLTLGIKFRLKDENAGVLPRTVWDSKLYNATAYGTSLLRHIFGRPQVFPFPKSLYAVMDCLRVCSDKKDAVILDFFSGSGTTGHAVLTLNKEDGGNRRFVLCTNNENNICEEVTYERLKRVMKGYTTTTGEKVDGLGGNLKYLKTDFVPKHVEYGLTDEARLDLTRRANLLLALKENTFTPIETADRYEIFSSPTRLTGVYFTEDKDDLDKMLRALKKHAKDKVVSVYIFSWKKGAYKSGFEDYPQFHFEDIPEPILDVYRSIGY